MSNPQWWRQPRPPFTGEVLAAAYAHASEEAPRESCGLITGGAYRRCRNTAADPAGRFRVDAADQLAALEAGPLQGVIHSHPAGPWFPSSADMAGQIETGVPWAIVTPGEPGELVCIWGDDGRPSLFDAAGAPRPRDFLHGISDCYTVVIDYFAERHAIELPDFPRDWEWWRDGGDLYRDGFAEAGFDQVAAADPDDILRQARPGDVILRAMRSRTPNHAGVYLGGSLMLEHHQSRFVERRPILTAKHGATHLLRHRALAKDAAA